MRVLLFFGTLFLLIACKQESPQTSTEEPKNSVSVLQDTISEATFIEWTTNWDSLGGAFSDTLLVKYFDMPIIDLEETIGENPAEARYYMGLENLGGGHYEAHLILTGINSLGNVIGSYFDVTKPCPPLCKNK